VWGGPEHLGDVEQPALAEDGHHRGLGRQQFAQVRVGFRPVGSMPSGAKGGEARLFPTDGLGGGKELDVLWLEPGPAAFDVRQAVLIEQAGDAQLVRPARG